MIPFVTVVVHELANRAPQRAFPDEEQPLQAGFLDRADEPLGECVQIRRPRGQAHRLHPAGRERVTLYGLVAGSASSVAPTPCVILTDALDAPQLIKHYSLLAGVSIVS